MDLHDGTTLVVRNSRICSSIVLAAVAVAGAGIYDSSTIGLRGSIVSDNTLKSRDSERKE